MIRFVERLLLVGGALLLLVGCQPPPMEQVPTVQPPTPTLLIEPTPTPMPPLVPISALEAVRRVQQGLAFKVPDHQVLAVWGVEGETPPMSWVVSVWEPSRVSRIEALVDSRSTHIGVPLDAIVPATTSTAAMEHATETAMDSPMILEHITTLMSTYRADAPLWHLVRLSLNGETGYGLAWQSIMQRTDGAYLSLVLDGTSGEVVSVCGSAQQCSSNAETLRDLPALVPTV